MKNTKTKISLIAISLIVFIGCEIDPYFSTHDHEAHTHKVNVNLTNFPKVVEPADNQTSVEGIRLGQHLFYDPAIQCVSCHLPEYAFTNPFIKSIDLTIHGKTVGRNPMPLFNLAWVPELAWEGREQGLEEKVRGSFITTTELSYDEIIASLKSSTLVDYESMFAAAFPDGKINPDNIDKAIAQFFRYIRAGDSRVHQFASGDKSALNAQEKLGMELFNNETGNCFHCHTTSLGTMTDNSFKNNGLTAATYYGDFEDPGRAFYKQDSLSYGLFRTPTLINVALTAPYMHDGSIATLEGVIDHYISGGHYSPTRDNSMIEHFDGETALQLTQEEKDALIAFLNALTDTSFLQDPLVVSPFD